MSKVNSLIKSQINSNNAATSSGLIATVTKYYPATFSNKKYAHTADISIQRGKKFEKMEKVPCFVYSTGLIDNGLQENDRVWVEFINGDSALPVITGYYREPTTWDFFKNSVHYSVSGIIDMLGLDGMFGGDD